MKNKSSLSSFSSRVTMAQWMKHRPYDQPSSYDTVWLKFTNDLYRQHVASDTRIQGLYSLSLAECREIAVLAVCWLEDYMHINGLWDTMRKKNRAAYGFPVPFYDLKDYEDENMNW